MKGYRFYLEYDSNKTKNAATRKNIGDHLGTVVAIIPNQKSCNCRSGVYYDGFAAVQNFPNNQVCSCNPSQGYLKGYCKRISEKQAREIHPNLFKYLDS